MEIKLSKVRIAFPQLFTPKTVNGEGAEAFSCSFLIPADSPQIAEINAAIDKVADEKWGAKAPAILKAMRAADKTALHDGELKSNYAGYSGHFYVSARNTSRPTIIDRDKTPLVEADGRPYSGCYVNAFVDIWAQDNSYGKRINASLGGVQFFKDGAAFVAGGAVSADKFDDLGIDEEEDSLV